MALQIVETTNQIKVKIISEVREEISRRFIRDHIAIKSRVGSIIASYISDSSATQSILGGKLKIDFGLTEAEASNAISKIINIVKQSVSVSLNVNPLTGLIFSLTVSVRPEEFIPNLSSQISYQSEGSYSNTSEEFFRDHEITWMKWLLTMGTTVIIDDYRVYYKTGKGRSRGGIMVSSTNSEGFRVDPEFAGVADSNFITDAVKESFPRIILVLREYLL